MVDCSVIATASLTERFCLSWSGRAAERFKNLGGSPAPLYPPRQAGGFCDVGIIDLAGRRLAAGLRPQSQGFADISGHRAAVMRLAAGGAGGAKQAVSGKEQFLSLFRRL